jgi:hypothetical protein
MASEKSLLDPELLKLFSQKDLSEGQTYLSAL